MIKIYSLKTSDLLLSTTSSKLVQFTNSSFTKTSHFRDSLSVTTTTWIDYSR